MHAADFSRTGNLSHSNTAELVERTTAECTILYPELNKTIVKQVAAIVK